MSIDRRVVVTGIGAVTPFGWHADDLWKGLLSASSAVAMPERLDTAGHRTREAGEVSSAVESIAEAFPAWSSWTWADRFAVVAARDALDQAFPVPPNLDACGVYFGGSTAGMFEGERFFRELIDDGPSRLRDLSSHQLNGPGDAVARHFGCRGPVISVSSACASGALALADALESLRDGEVNVALAGGSDALCQLTYAGFNALRAVDPEHCRPFRAERGGLNLGEGAGVLVLERLTVARARGAQILAELKGAGASCDAHHMTAPHPEGEGAARAIRNALADAGVSSEAVDFVNAHGTGTPLNDSSEAAAIKAVFGPSSLPPVMSAKGAIGHFLGAAGAVEAVVSVLAVQHGRVPPTHGSGALDESCPIDLISDEPRSLPSGRTSVSTNFAFGGANAAVVIAPVGEAPSADPDS